MTDPRDVRPEGEPPDDEIPLAETLFLAGELQKSRSDESSWTRMAEKVEAFLQRVHGRSRLPDGWEFPDLQQIVLAKLVEDLPRIELRSREEFWGWVREARDYVSSRLG